MVFAFLFLVSFGTYAYVYACGSTLEGILSGTHTCDLAEQTTQTLASRLAKSDLVPGARTFLSVHKVSYTSSAAKADRLEQTYINKQTLLKPQSPPPDLLDDLRPTQPLL